MPERIDAIISTVNEIASLYTRLQQTPDADLADRLEARASDLASIFKGVADNAKRLVGDKRNDALAKINKVLTVENATSLLDFFEKVSTALIEAQRQLNQRSLEYVAGLDPRIPPAHYVIPTVKAEMNVGFSQISQRGVNVILFTKSEQKQHYGQSTVTMELVAAPPPPGIGPFGGFAVPIPRFLLLGKDRASLLERLQQRAPHLKTKTYENAKSLAAVLAYDKKASTDASEYLIIWPGQAAGMINWAEITVARVVDKQVELEFDGTIFESPPPKEGFVRIGSLADVRKLSLDEAALLAINVGDAVWNVLLVLNTWLASVMQPVTPPPKG